MLRGALSLLVWLSLVVVLSRPDSLVFGTGLGLLAFGIFMALVYAACVRFIEGRVPSEFSLARSGSEWLAGFGLGLLIFVVTIGIFALAGWYRPIAFTWSLGAFASGLELCISTAFVEEIALRGYAFRFLQNGFGTWAAIGGSALIFGFLHALNPGASAWTSVAIAIEAGILLAAAFAMTGRLWLPIGIHTSWNFAEGTIFGTPVSGTQFPTLMSARLDGPAMLTGGAFGPEGSIVTVAVCVALSAWFIARIVAERRVVPPLWLRAKPPQPAAA